MVGSPESDLSVYKPGICYQTEDLIELNQNRGLWLKPISKINITVALPPLKQPGQCITTHNVIERLWKRIKPCSFKTLKVIKSTLEFIRFEAELESKSIMETVINKLDRTTLRLDGFVEQLKVKAAKLKLGSSRHEWETFFRDDPTMDELKPGLRADTIHIKNLPIKWFGGDQPKPHLLLETFQVYGDIRRFHIPYLDTIESKSNQSSGTGFKRFNFTETLNFDAFIMYRDYIGFVKAMDALRSKKLVKKLDEVNKYLEYEMTVDFDKTKHLSDKEIKRRTLVRKYGLNDFKDLKDFKNHAKKEKERYQERFKLLKERKKKAEKLLKLLFTEVEKELEVKKAKEEEEKRQRKEKEEKKLEEETKLKEKLEEEKKSNNLSTSNSSSSHNIRCNQGSEPGLKSIAVSLTKSSRSDQVVQSFAVSLSKDTSNGQGLRSIAIPLNNNPSSSDYNHSRNHHNNYHPQFNRYTHPNHRHYYQQNRYHKKDSQQVQQPQQPQQQKNQFNHTRSSFRLNRSYPRDESKINPPQRKVKRHRSLIVQVTWEDTNK